MQAFSFKMGHFWPV